MGLRATGVELATRPTVLLVAAPGHARSLPGELDEAGISVLVTPPGEEAVRQAAALAPDLVLVDASVSGASVDLFLAALRRDPVGRTLGLFQVGAEAPPAATGFAFGRVDAVLGAPGPAEVAGEVRRALNERAAWTGVVSGRVTPAELPELLDGLETEGRTGVMAVFASDGDGARPSRPGPEGRDTPLMHPIVLEEGRGVIPTREAFLARLRASAPGSPLRWEFLEKAPGSLRVVGPVAADDPPVSPAAEPGEPSPSVPVVVVGANALGAGGLARALVRHQPAAKVTADDDDAVSRLARVDPAVLVVEVALLTAASYPALRALATHPRTAGAGWVLAHGAAAPGGSLDGAVDALAAPEGRLASRVEAEPEGFRLRLEGLGPGRLLRGVGAGRPLVGFRVGEGDVLDLGGGRLLGGAGERAGRRVGDGQAALGRVLGRRVGGVAVERLRRPARVDLSRLLSSPLEDPPSNGPERSPQGGGPSSPSREGDPSSGSPGDAPTRPPRRPLGGSRRRAALLVGALCLGLGGVGLAGSFFGGGSSVPEDAGPEGGGTPGPRKAGEPPVVTPTVAAAPPPENTGEGDPATPGGPVGRADAVSGTPAGLAALVRGLGETAAGQVAAPEAAQDRGREPDDRGPSPRLARLRAIDAREARAWEEAERWLRVVLHHRPRDAVSTRELALALFRQRRVVDAVPWARRAALLAPGEPAGWVLLGDLLGAKRELEAAERAWRQALAVAPGDPPARRRLDRLGVDVDGLLAELAVDGTDAPVDEPAR
jgi:hypothetical protein